MNPYIYGRRFIRVAYRLWSISPTMAVYQQEAQESSSYSVHEDGHLCWSSVQVRNFGEVDSMPAKEQEQAGKEQAKAPFFYVLYIGYHQQKVWVAQIEVDSSYLKRSGFQMIQARKIPNRCTHSLGFQLILDTVKLINKNIITKHFPDLSAFLADFIFLWLYKILCCICMAFSLSILLVAHLGWFHFLVIVHRTAVNMNVQVSLRQHRILWSMPRSGIAGTHARSF